MFGVGGVEVFASAIYGVCVGVLSAGGEKNIDLTLF